LYKKKKKLELLYKKQKKRKLEFLYKKQKKQKKKKAAAMEN